MTLKAKALLCWGLLTPLTLLNPTPTGGALLVIAPLAVFTYYTTKDWLYDRTHREAHQEAAEAAG